MLVVEDNDDHFELLVEMLSRALPTTEVARARTLRDAQRTVARAAPTCALLDLSLPDASGLEVIGALRTSASSLPIIVVTATQDEGLGMDAVRQGAQDYLVKGRFDVDGLRRAISYAVERSALEARLMRQALFDPLTDLPNRTLFVERLGQALRDLEREPGTVAVFFLDLDGFKDVNDILGHDVGDRVLQMVAARLSATVPAAHTVARLGGDEFTVLASGLAGPYGANRLAEELLGAFASPFPLDDTDQYLSASVGVALAEVPVETGVLLRDADTAMYRAKEKGGGRSEIFDDRLRDRVLARFKTVQGLRGAVTRSEFELRYQPQVDLATTEAFGVEALLRWRHPTLGLVGPDHFLQAAEDSRLIVPIGRWVLAEACTEAHAWPGNEVWVNVSAYQLERPDFLTTVDATLRDTELEPAQLGIEITESCLVSDARAAAVVLRAVRAMGVRVAIDDFGIGYSSLRSLQYLPVDVLKLDRSFVAELDGPNARTAIVASVISLAHGLGLTVVAEGVETESQRQILLDLGCDSAQGYLFAPPLPASAWRARSVECQ